MLRQRYGDAVRGEVLERTIQQSWQKALEEREIRPASEPKIEIVTFEDGEDLEYKLAVELMPDIDDFDLAKVELERPVVPVTDEEIDKSLERLAANNKKYEAAEGCAAEDQDQILIDFKGTVEGKEFPGSSMEGFELVLGQGGFLPGFDGQLIGVQAGEKKQITVTMPEDFGNDDLKGKEVAFDVTVKEVRKAVLVEINNDLAKASGFEDLAALRIGIQEQLDREYGRLARASLKRALLDKLADEVKFELPKTMVDGEFDTIWKQISEAKEKGSLEEADKDKSEEELKENYLAIAERRVRLGIFLAEVGRKNNITVTQDDLNRAMHTEAARFPGQEAAVLEYFQKNDSAKNELQAPIFEDKVVDFIVELAKVTEKEVSLEDLMKLDQPDDNEKKTD